MLDAFKRLSNAACSQGEENQDTVLPAYSHKVSRPVRGWICVSWFCLQQGYQLSTSVIMPMVPLSSKGIQTANGYVLTGKYHAMQPQGGHKGGMNPGGGTPI